MVGVPSNIGWIELPCIKSAGGTYSDLGPCVLTQYQRRTNCECDSRILMHDWDMTKDRDVALQHTFVVQVIGVLERSWTEYGLPGIVSGANSLPNVVI